MGFKPEEIAAAASQVISKLTANGQIGGENGTKSLTLKREDSGVPFDKSLIGLRVKDYKGGRRKLVVSEERPALSGGAAEGRIINNIPNIATSDTIDMAYNTYGSYLSKPCFLISGAMLRGACSLFISGNVYDTLLYAYEETTDNLGLGLTFQKGWYALSATTFANEPINIEEYPVYIRNDDVLFVAATEEEKAFFESCFPLAETVEFTVKAENIVDTNDFTYVFNCNASHVSFDNLENVYAWTLELIGSFTISSGTIQAPGMGHDGDYVTVTWTEGIKPIDPKYLPGVCMSMVDMSDVLIYTEGTANITLTAEHLARLGMDGNPKFILCDFFGGLKVTALLLPLFEEGNFHVGYGGMATVETGFIGISIVIDGEGGVASIRLSAA